MKQKLIIAFIMIIIIRLYLQQEKTINTMITFTIICRAIFFLMGAHPVLGVLRMTYMFIKRKDKSLYWAIPASLLSVAFYVWIVSLFY